MNRMSILSSGEFDAFVGLVRTCVASMVPTQDTRRLALLGDRLAVDRSALTDDEFEQFVFLAGSVGSRIANAELRSKFLLKLDLLMAERPLPGDGSNAAGLIDAARDIGRNARE